MAWLVRHVHLAKPGFRVGTPTHCQQLEKMTESKQEGYGGAGVPDALGSRGGQGRLLGSSAVQEIEAKGAKALGSLGRGPDP